MSPFLLASLAHAAPAAPSLAVELVDVHSVTFDEGPSNTLPRLAIAGTTSEASVHDITCSVSKPPADHD